MNDLFLDTAYVLALVNSRDSFHNKAKDLAGNSLGIQKVTTMPILLEIGNALARKFRVESVEILERFQNSGSITVVPFSDDDFADGFELYRLHDDKTWSLTDCISFAVMRRFNIHDALTSDKHFEQAGFTILMK